MSALALAEPRIPVENVPSDIRDSPQWVAWKYIKRRGKPTKAPVNPLTGGLADATNPKTWGTFHQAMDVCSCHDGLAGVGFVFSADDPYCGVDLDDCIDPETGIVSDWAIEIIADLDSYTEISPSGSGVKVFLRAEKPGERCRKAYHSGEVEIYDCNRFFTVTGEEWPNVSAEVEQRQSELARVYDSVLGKTSNSSQPEKATPFASSVCLGDEEIIALAKRQRRSGAKFASLWGGNWDGYFQSASEADSSLVFTLAFYTKDAVQIDRIFRSSGLMRDKWDEKHGEQSYGQMTIARALEKVTKQYQPKYESKPAANSTLSAIFIEDVQLNDLTNIAVDAIIKENTSPKLFVRSGKLSRVTFDENARPVIANLGCPELRCHLSKVANFYAIRKIAGEIRQISVNPPKTLAENIVALGSWDLPPLAGITQAPILRSDGSICTKPGYDPESRLMYCPDPSLNLPTIPEHPTRGEIQYAVELLQKVIDDFPFTDDASRANALAILLSILLRPVITGHVPLAIVDAPTQGTGKSLLVTVLGMIAVGNVAAESIPSKVNDDEWRKKITTILLNASPFVLLDNIPDNTTIDSPALAAALTAREWSDRILGRNESIRVPARSIWVATGNNIRVAGDMPRRSYSVRLDANLAKPWERTDFQIGDLEQYVMDHRGELLAATFTLIRGWFANGKPRACVPAFGSFGEWASIVGGVLKFAGVPGFLGNLKQTQTVQDEETQEWSAFFDQWWEEFEDTPATVDDLCRRLVHSSGINGNSLPDAVSAQYERGDAALRRSLGRHLARLAGRIFDGHKLEDAGRDSRRKVRRWRLAGLITPQNNSNPATNPAQKGVT